MKSNITRFERGQIWIYDDHKNKKDKKTCMAEKGILIGHRPVLILSVKGKYITVIKGSKRKKHEKSQVEYNDGINIGVFDTLQMKVLNTDIEDLTYSAKIENAILRNVDNTINLWLFSYIDEYNERGISGYLKRQVWEYNDNGTTKLGIIINKFKKSVVVIPLTKIQHLESDHKFELYEDDMYTDITFIHTIPTSQLLKYNFTISEEIYSSIINNANIYLRGENTDIRQKEFNETPKKKRIKKHKSNHTHNNKPINKEITTSKIETIDNTDNDNTQNNKTLKKIYCPKVFRSLSYDEMVKEFNTYTSKELANKYSVSTSTIRRTKLYLKDIESKLNNKE